MEKNIILIGMPGAGKSTIGARLAKSLNLTFLDTDDVIEQMTGEPLQSTLQNRGLDGFLNAERDAILTLDCHNTIIATGGSVILRDESMTYLRSIGKVFYLRLPLCSISRRIKNFETRGIAKRENDTLWQIYKQRVPLYEKYCHVKINCNKKHVDKIIGLIKANLKEDM